MDTAEIDLTAEEFSQNQVLESLKRKTQFLKQTKKECCELYEDRIYIPVSKTLLKQGVALLLGGVAAYLAFQYLSKPEGISLTQ